MTIAEYTAAAVGIDAAVGLVLGLGIGWPRVPARVAGILAVSAGLAFAGLSAMVVVYEVMNGTGRPSAGMAWVAMYAPFNFVLCLAAPAFYSVGAVIRAGIRRSAA